MEIKVQGLSKSYQRNRAVFPALSEISLEFKGPAIVAILGPNGAGKTTLLKIICGISSPGAGSVLCESRPVNDPAGAGIGFSPENPFFFKNLTPEELLQLGLDLSDEKLGHEKISAVLRQVGLYEERCLRIGTFSKGMLQRLSLAAAIIQDPGVLILDEPMSGLDPLGRNMVKEVMRDFYEQKRLLIFSTHNLEDVETIATDLVILKGGRVVLCEKMANLRRFCSFLVETENAGSFQTREAGDYQELQKILREYSTAPQSLIRVRSNIAKKLESYYE